MRVYDKGAYIGVSLNTNDIQAFRQQWPASGLHALKRVYFEYQVSNGDLVDMRCNQRSSCGKFDGPALLALANDAQHAALAWRARKRAGASRKV